MKSLKTHIAFLIIGCVPALLSAQYDFDLEGGAWASPSAWTKHAAVPNNFPQAGDTVGMLKGTSVNLDSNHAAGVMTLDTTGTVNIRGNTASNTFTLTIGTVNVINSGSLRFVNHTTNSNIIGGLISVTTANLDSGRLFAGGSSGLTGGYAAGSTNLDGGLFVADFRGPNGGVDVGAVTFTAASGSTLNILGDASTGGNLEVASLSGGDAGTYVQLSSVASNVTAGNGTVILNNSAGSTFDGIIRDNHVSFKLSLVKDGSGSQTFTRANTYTGDTTINSGALVLEGDGTLGGGDIALSGGNWDMSGISGGTYVVAVDQTLSAGAGTVVADGKALSIGGTLSRDSSPGVFTVQGGLLDISSADALVFELGASAGTVTLSGGADLDIGILDFSDFTFVTLMDFGAGQYTLLSGWETLFGSLGDDSGTIDGYNANLLIQGDSLILDVVAIPEANTVAVALLALAVAFFSRRARGMRR